MDIAYDQKLTGRESDVEQRKSSINGLMQWNNLVYTMPITNSVATARNVKFYPASSDLYDSQNNTKMVFTVQTGSQFVDFSKSYLKFSMKTDCSKLETGSNPQFESICNIIESIVVSSRQGVELLRIKDFARWRVIQNALNLSTTKYDTVAGLLFSGDTAVKVCEKDATTDCVIPMWLLGGFFESTQLLPPALCAGLRIEITLLGVKKAFKVTPGTPPGTNYTIHNPTLCLDTTLLNDAATRQVRANAAANGLEITYRDVYHQSTGVKSKTFEVPITKAVSRALCAYAVPWNEYTTDGDGKNFFAETTTKIEKYQWRLGSSYYPQREILTSPREQFVNAIYCFEYDQTSETKSKMVYKDWEKFQLMCATLERSALLKYSGRSINNSTTLQLSAVISENTNLTIYLEHVKIAKVFNTNVVVSL